MARNRKRAKQRKQEQRIQRENVPGELDHASGDAEQFEAGIVSGAGGEPVSEPESGAPAPLSAYEASDHLQDSELEPVEIDDAALDAEALGAGAGDLARPPLDGPGAAQRSGGRFTTFLRACWAELQRVQWPDRRQVGQATAVVLGFVVIAGAFLGLSDVVAQRVVDFIL